MLRIAGTPTHMIARRNLRTILSNPGASNVLYHLRRPVSTSTYKFPTLQTSPNREFNDIPPGLSSHQHPTHSSHNAPLSFGQNVTPQDVLQVETPSARSESIEFSPPRKDSGKETSAVKSSSGSSQNSAPSAGDRSKESSSDDEGSVLKEDKDDEEFAPAQRSGGRTPKRRYFTKELDYELFKTMIFSNELDDAEELLDRFHREGYWITIQIYNVLIRSFIKQGQLERALKVFASVQNGVGDRAPNARTITTLISGCIQQRSISYLPMLFKHIQVHSIRPEKLISERYYRKETSQIAYICRSSGPIDPQVSVKLPDGCPYPDGKMPPNSHRSASGLPISVYEKQFMAERSRVEDRVKYFQRRSVHINELGRGAELLPSKKLIIGWFEPLQEAIRKEQERLEAEFDWNNDPTILDNLPPEKAYAKYLRQVPPDQLAIITIHEALGQVLTDANGVKFTQVAQAIGNAAQAESHFKKVKRNLRTSQKKFIERRAKNTIGRLKALRRTENKSSDESEDTETWAAPTLVQLGGFLVGLLVETVEIELLGGTRVKAFEHSMKTSKRKMQGMLTAHPEVIRRVDPLEATKECFDPKLLPMYTVPKPWMSTRNGGYFYANTRVMRSYARHQVEALKGVDLSEIYQMLNMLGSLPWKINRRVFDVMKEGWNRGGNLPYVPTRQNYRSPNPPFDFRVSPESRLVWRKERFKTDQKNRELHSLRCDFTLKLHTAEILLNESSFYFPHNMDFRGRVYPIPPHLNHMGSDLSRGLLQFAEGKPLGTDGLFWLKNHLASLYGVNKVAFEDRVKFVDDHIHEVIDSAENPLDGRRWWEKADDAWQALGVCFELRDALQLKDPTKFVSYTPIHMDGSCNGLQHYAALGGDIEGGRSVNLLPAEIPQDVYSHVLRSVLNMVDQDAQDGHPLAQNLVGKITRKTIKQTVMTSVYGVTYIGARKQIAGQLKDQAFLSDEDLFPASKYITKVTFDAMQSMFTGAREIMAWLSDTARTVGRTGAPMAWVTPIGLPVEQHYRRPGRLQIKTLLQSVVLVENSDSLPVLVQKQRSAFPPNYVHSLDSTHMFYTAKMCSEAGISFAAVHDSYWTHACTVDKMNYFLREAFVKLHSRPLLEELREQVTSKYPTLEIQPIPTRGPLEINRVRESRYFFH